MSALVKSPEEAKAEAAYWLARLRADTKTAADEAGFRKWLAEHPANAAAFESMTDIWETLGRARRRPVEAPVETHFVSRRRLVMAGGAAMAVVTAGLVFRGGAEAAVYETGVGEQRHVVLGDGTQAFLDTSTRLRMAYDGTTRQIDLECGRCNFDVMANDTRPFVVNAAETKIVAGRTTLDVARDGEDVTVVLIRGSAAVSGGRLAAEKPCVMKPGERLVVQRSGMHLDKPDLARALAWQSGQVVFENVTLAEAARELNRYSVVKIDTDLAVAPLRISGVFHVGDNVAFAQLAAQLLPIAVHVEADRVQLMKSAPRERNG